ncbi:MAG: hypothetical protein RLZZ414_1992 [Bacteroidota bacterium]|jgi:hypothetical protein
MATQLDYVVELEKQTKILSRLRIEKEQYINASKYVRNSNEYILFMLEYQRTFFKVAQIKKILKNKYGYEE